MIEIPINKEISYKSLLELNFAGDKSINLSGIKNNVAKNKYFIWLSMNRPASLTPALNIFYHRLFGFVPLAYPPDTCNITLHYKAKEVKVFFPQKPKMKLRPTPILEPEPEPTPVPVPEPTQEPTQDQEPFRWLWAVLLFVIVLIILQKASNK